MHKWFRSSGVPIPSKVYSPKQCDEKPDDYRKLGLGKCFEGKWLIFRLYLLVFCKGHCFILSKSKESLCTCWTFVQWVVQYSSGVQMARWQVAVLWQSWQYIISLPSSNWCRLIDVISPWQMYFAVMSSLYVILQDDN